MSTNYICKRCDTCMCRFYDFIRHLNRKNICKNKNNIIFYSDDQLFILSLIPYYNNVHQIKEEDIEYLNVIAQEFAEVFPNDVKESGEKMPDGSPILQVDIHPLTIYSAAAIQELKQIIDSQNLRISELESKLL